MKREISGLWEIVNMVVFAVYICIAFQYLIAGKAEISLWLFIMAVYVATNSIYLKYFIKNQTVNIHGADSKTWAEITDKHIYPKRKNINIKNKKAMRVDSYYGTFKVKHSFGGDTPIQYFIQKKKIETKKEYHKIEKFLKDNFGKYVKIINYNQVQPASEKPWGEHDTD
jgi:hypothetical protein